jgi:hypothetical protein
MIYNLNYSDVKLVKVEKKNGQKHFIVYADGDFYEGQTGKLIVDTYYLIDFLAFDAYIKYAKIW